MTESTENKENTLYASILSESPDDAALLDMWLDERAAEFRSQTAALPGVVSATRQDNARLARVEGEYDGDISPGQIRILSKRFATNPDIVPYVAILEEWHKGMWLVAPFSRYSYPATPGEMVTGIRHSGLRVLQVWNSRTMHGTLLGKSYLFGKLPESVRQNGIALFRHEMGGVDLPGGFPALRGGSIIMACDPRREYLSEEIARLQPLSVAVKATERMMAEDEAEAARDGEGDVKLLPPLFGKTAFLDETYRMAAGTRKPQTESYDVGGVALDMEFSPEADDVLMTFYGKDDEKYNGYDGFGLFGGNREFLGCFQDGSIRVPAACVRGSFMIVNADGEAVPVADGK